jgi:hypothetical protein
MKAVTIILIALVISTTATAQRMTKKVAREIIEKSLTCLKTGDTATFISMWKLDDMKWPYHDRAFQKKDVIANFKFMREFIDTAVIQNLPIDEIEIEPFFLTDSVETPISHTIRVWFRYNDLYFKGYGLHMQYIDDRWFARFDPDTSIIKRRLR